jgi:phosphomannomutase/phosphoglucomutase
MTRASSKKSTANAVRLSGLLSIAVGVFGVLLGALLLYTSMQGRLDVEQASRAAQDQARSIGDSLGRIQAALDNPQVIELARAALRDSAETSAALEAAVQSRGVANIIDLRVFPAAIENIPLGEYPAPDFTVIEMLIEARRNGRAPMQIHYPGSVNENLALAQAVQVDSGVEGILFMRVPVSMASSLLQISGLLDFVALVQGEGENAYVLRSIGPTRGDAEVTPIAGSRFSLNWSRRSFASSVSKQSAVIVLSIGVILLMVGLLIRQRFGALSTDSLKFELKPKRVEPEPFSVSQPAPIRRRERRPSKRPPPKKPAVAPDPVVDDLPDWLLDSDEIDQTDAPLGDSGDGAEDLPDLPDTLSDSVDDTVGVEGRASGDEPDLIADTMFFNPDETDFIEPEEMRREETADAPSPDDQETLVDDEVSGKASNEADALSDTVEGMAFSPDLDFVDAPSSDSLDALLRDEDETDGGKQDGIAWDDFKNEIEQAEAGEDGQAALDELEQLARPGPAEEAKPEFELQTTPEAESVDEVAEEPDPATSAPSEAPSGTSVLAPELFRANSISGVVGEHLDARAATLIGEAIGSEAKSRGIERIVIGRDGRMDGAMLLSALAQGLQSTGVDVVDLGALPIPVLNFAAAEMSEGSSVMVTGSHYPPDHNGFRIRLNHELLHDRAIQALGSRIDEQDLSSGSGELIEEEGVIERYIERLGIDIQLERPLKVVVDCGNGIAGSVVPEALGAIGANVIPLYADVDGTFPNHLPNPADPDNLQDLKLCVRNFQADLGLAFDGDGDRMAMVSSEGEVVWTDRILMLLAPEILERNAGARVVIDSASGAALKEMIQAAGGKPIVERSAEAFVDHRMREDKALLGGLFSGHLFIAERWYPFDDAIYASARLLEQLAADTRPIAEILGQLPDSKATPEIRVELCDGEAEDLVTALIAEGDFGDGELSMVDGLRVDYPDGWGLVRASHRSPDLVLRFEGESDKALHRIQALFKKQIQARDSRIKLVF